MSTRRMRIALVLLVTCWLLSPDVSARDVGASDGDPTGIAGEKEGPVPQLACPGTVVWDTGMYDELFPPEWCPAGIGSSCFVEAINQYEFPPDGRRLADDFVAETDAPITHVKLWGQYNAAGFDYHLANPGSLHGFCIKFYGWNEFCPDGSIPGEEAIGPILYSQYCPTFVEEEVLTGVERTFVYCVTLPVPFTPDPGTPYWFSASADFDFTFFGEETTEWYWRVCPGTGIGQCEASWWDTWGEGETPWEPISFIFEGECWQGWDAAFVLYASPSTTGACCDPYIGSCTVMTRAQCDSLEYQYQGDETTCDPDPCPPPGACCLNAYDCLYVTEWYCGLNGGFWQGDSTECETHTCQPGACCFVDGHCEVMTSILCQDQGGEWQAGIDCFPNPCEPLGACCLPTGACEILKSDECAGLGEWHGEISACAPNPCPQPEACCFDDGGCRLRLAAACEEEGGIAQGVDTDCEPNPCTPPATGACCFVNGSCEVLTRPLCLERQGTYQGDGSGCDQNPCRGACCFLDGTCAFLADPQCQEAGGAYQGHGTDCEPNLCPPPATGACCFVDGSCEVLTRPLCLDRQGAYQGNASDCDPNPCPQPMTGACCFADGSCEVLTRPLCLDRQGAYQGNASDCDPNPCRGACCFADGGCTFLSLPRCLDAGGTYEGYGSDCDPNLCPQPATGACCFVNGNCEVLTQIGCLDNQGMYQGDDSDCDPNPCRGACCFADGTCTFVALPQCNLAGGTYDGYGTDCDPNLCPQPATGACCLADGDCEVLTRALCLGDQGTYQGDNSDCDPNPCRGACCFADGTCTFVTMPQCSQAGGTYYGYGTDCDPNLCPQPGTGACCSANGNCEVLTQALCLGEQGAYQGDDSACDPNPCRGACCLADGTCIFAAPDQCAEAGGAYQSHDMACTPNPCPQPARGGCCLDTEGCRVLTEAACDDSGGQYAGDNTDCSPNPCTDVVDAMTIDSAGGGYRWRITVKDPVSELRGWYRPGGRIDYAGMQPFSSSDGLTWYAVLAPTDWALRGLEAHLRYTNQFGIHLAHGSEAAPIRIPIAGSLQVALAPAYSYRMVSAPMQVTGREDTNGLMTGLFGLSGPTNWIMGRWDPSLAGYREVSENAPEGFATGAAYWIAFSRIVSWTLSGAASYPNAGSSAFEIPLQPGWNMVGNPAAYRIAMDQTALRIVDTQGNGVPYSVAVQTDPPMVSPLYLYDPETAPEGTHPYTLDPAWLDTWEGCWIHNGTSAGLTLAIPAVEHEQDLARADARRDQKNGLFWSLSIHAMAGSENAGVRIGTVEPGAAGLGTHDRPMPPSVPGAALWIGLRADSPSDEDPRANRLLIEQVRSSAERVSEWRLELGSPDDPVELRWNEEMGGSPAPALTLTDSIDGRRRDMRAVRSLALPAGSYVFTILRGGDGQASGETTEFSFSASPNPLRSEIDLRLNIPAPGDLDLEVVDARGVKVWKHRARVVQAGEHIVIWDATDQNGARVPAGVYFAFVRLDQPGPGQQTPRSAALKLSVLP